MKSLTIPLKIAPLKAHNVMQSVELVNLPFSKFSSGVPALAPNMFRRASLMHIHFGLCNMKMFREQLTGHGGQRGAAQYKVLIVSESISPMYIFNSSQWPYIKQKGFHSSLVACIIFYLQA